jgi:hypothetical protein
MLCLERSGRGGWCDGKESLLFCCSKEDSLSMRGGDDPKPFCCVDEIYERYSSTIFVLYSYSRFYQF